MNSRQLFFNHIKWFDSSIGAIITFFVLSWLVKADFFHQGPSIPLVAIWMFVIVLTLVMFLSLYKRDILKSFVRELLIRNNDKVCVKVYRETYEGNAIILPKDEISNYLKAYKQISKKRWFNKKLIGPTIAVDVGNK